MHHGIMFVRNKWEMKDAELRNVTLLDVQGHEDGGRWHFEFPASSGMAHLYEDMCGNGRKDRP